MTLTNALAALNCLYESRTASTFGGESWNHIIALISSCFELTNTGDCVNSSVAGTLADYLVMSTLTELEREC